MSTNVLQLSKFGCQHGYMVNVAQKWQTSGVKSLFSHSGMTGHFTAAAATLTEQLNKRRMACRLRDNLNSLQTHHSHFLLQ